MSEPLLRLIQSFRSRRVRFLTIGGVAMVLYGVERATFDVDILVPPDGENLKKLLSVLKRFDFQKAYALRKGGRGGVRKLGRLRKLDPAKLMRYWAIRIVNGQQLDVLFSPSPSLFDFMWQRRKRARIRGVLIPCPSLQDLIRLKALSQRPRDVYDVQALRQISRIHRRKAGE